MAWAWLYCSVYSALAFATGSSVTATTSGPL